MTAPLTFGLDPVAQAVTALLKSPGNLDIHVGRVEDSDDNAKTISAPLPYALVNYTVPFASSVRAGGRVGNTLRFSIGYAGSTEEQAIATAQAVREFLNGATVTADRAYRIRLEETDSVAVARDDTWNRPDGGPIFYGRDRFVAV